VGVADGVRVSRTGVPAIVVEGADVTVLCALGGRVLVSAGAGFSGVLVAEGGTRAGVRVRVGKPVTGIV